MKHNYHYDKNALFCYETYKSLKLHFTAAYDFFKYQGKSLSHNEINGFEDSKYFHYCNKISKGKTKNEIVEYLLANTLMLDDKWIDSMVGADEIWKEWKKIQESLTYRFTADTKVLFEPPMHISRYFKPIDGGYPPVIIKLMRKEISLESVVVLDVIFGFNDRLKNKYDGDFVGGPITKLICKYRPFFVKYHNLDVVENVDRFKKIVKKRIEETENILPF
jgi:hypothetical protein